MRQVFSTTKGIRVVDVPGPMLQHGNILVEVEYSFVSSGTELAVLGAMESQGGSLTKHIATKPGLINKLTTHLRQRGITKTVSTVFDFFEKRAMSQERLVAIGYSCSGTVVAVGEDVTLFEPGDRVACAGSSKATHSELVLIPENLIIKIPKGCSMKDAASVAVGAVAMQGLRRADVRLGESVGILGLGLLGLFTVQLMRQSGARVICFDPNPERADQAKMLGIDEAYHDMASFRQAVSRFTKHMGVDACLITASSQSSEIVQTAMEITRQKGKVVVVGLVGMHVQKSPFLRKEIDFLVSCSYGPGRYDERYEEKALDYPYAYVRWTEKRNMLEYLQLLAEKRLNLESFAGEEFPLEFAGDAYARLKNPKDRPAALFIRYSKERTLKEKMCYRVDRRSIKRGERVRIAVVGAGNFVRRVHLPSIKRLEAQAHLVSVLTRTGAKSMELARQFDADSATTSLEEILKDPKIDAVLIGTRHNLHTEMTLRALRAGKHVFVEKPLAMNDEELRRIEAFYEKTDELEKRPLLMTGFNRRFSPFAVKLKEWLQQRRTPLIMNYEINAGFLAEDHWLRTKEGGGRNIGEACHVYDLFTYLVESPVVSIQTSHVNLLDSTHDKNDNFIATLTFENGSIGTLTYTSLGCSQYPKETMRVYCDEIVYLLSDYRKLEVFGKSLEPPMTEGMEKGHFEEMESFVRAIGEGGDWPIPLWQQVQATRIANTVERQIQEGCAGLRRDRDT